MTAVDNNTSTYTPTEHAVAEALIVGDSDDKLGLLPPEMQERMLAKARGVVEALGHSNGRPHNVIEALARVERELPGINKGQQMNAEGQNYSYRGIEQITAEAGPLLGKYGVVFVPKVLSSEPVTFATRNGGQMIEWRAMIAYTVYGPGGPEDRIEAGPFFTLARDVSDKGIQKCMTSAYKQLLLQLLCVGDRKDDVDNEVHEAAPSRTVDPPDPDKQARIDLARRVKALSAEERTELRGFCEENTIPPVPGQMDDNELEAVTAWLDALEVRKPAAATTTEPSAPPEAPEAVQPTLTDSVPTPPAAATPPVETGEQATRPKPDPERLSRAQQTLKEAEEVAGKGQAEMTSVEEEVIRDVTAMSPKDVDFQLSERSLGTTGNLDSRRQRLAAALIRERAGDRDA